MDARGPRFFIGHAYGSRARPSQTEPDRVGDEACGLRLQRGRFDLWTSRQLRCATGERNGGRVLDRQGLGRARRRVRARGARSANLPRRTFVQVRWMLMFVVRADDAVRLSSIWPRWPHPGRRLSRSARRSGTTHARRRAVVAAGTGANALVQVSGLQAREGAFGARPQGRVAKVWPTGDTRLVGVRLAGARPGIAGGSF